MHVDNRSPRGLHAYFIKKTRSAFRMSALSVHLERGLVMEVVRWKSMLMRQTYIDTSLLLHELKALASRNFLRSIALFSRITQSLCTASTVQERVCDTFCYSHGPSIKRQHNFFYTMTDTAKQKFAVLFRSSGSQSSQSPARPRPAPISRL